MVQTTYQLPATGVLEDHPLRLDDVEGQVEVLVSQMEGHGAFECSGRSAEAPATLVVCPWASAGAAAAVAAALRGAGASARRWM